MQSFLEKLSEDVVYEADLRQKEIINVIVKEKFCRCVDKNEYHCLISFLNSKILELNTMENKTGDYYYSVVMDIKYTRRKLKIYDLCLYCKIKEKVRNRNYINCKKGFLDV